MKRSSAKQPPRRVAPKKGVRRSRTRLDVDARRAQLVELGLAEFGSRTYDEVSIDLIAQTAGISKGLLYHYFPTKRAFYVACVREAASRLMARMEDLEPMDAPPLEGLRAGLDAYLEYVRGHGRAYANLMRSGVGVDREVAAVVDQTRATLLARLTKGLAIILPTAADAIASPLLQIALHGWIGLAEAASIAWVEACVEAEATTRGRQNMATSPRPPTASEIRDLLANALVVIVQSIAQR